MCSFLYANVYSISPTWNIIFLKYNHNFQSMVTYTECVRNINMKYKRNIYNTKKKKESKEQQKMAKGNFTEPQQYKMTFCKGFRIWANRNIEDKKNRNTYKDKHIRITRKISKWEHPHTQFWKKRIVNIHVLTKERMKNILYNRKTFFIENFITIIIIIFVLENIYFFFASLSNKCNNSNEW